MTLRKRRLFAKVVSIIMLSSTVITSDGIVLAVEAGEIQEIAINQENKKTENVIVADLEDNFVTDSSGSDETEVTNSSVSSFVTSDMSADIMMSENSGVSLLSSSDELVSGDYTYTVFGNEATITGYTGSSTVVSIPSSIGGYTVIGIGNYAFVGCSNIEEIGAYAFYNCNDITIYGYTNSYAETYAKENNIPFMDVGEMDSTGYDSYVVGSLSSVDALSGTVTINGTTYNVSEDLDLTLATSILLNGDCKTVIALKKKWCTNYFGWGKKCYTTESWVTNSCN